MSIYKPSLLDKFKDFVNGLRANWEAYEGHVGDFEAHLAESANKAHGGFKGTLVRVSTNQSIPHNTATEVRFNDIIYEDLPCTITRITIPAGVSKVKIMASIMWGGTGAGASESAYRRITLLKNGSIFTGSSQHELPSIANLLCSNISSPVINVSEGDYFQVRAQQTTGSSLSILDDPRSWFAVEVVE